VTYTEALLASCLRSTLVMVLGVIVARFLVGWIAECGPGLGRMVRCVLLAIPFLTPNLMVGFGYRMLSINLLNQPWLNELLYFALIGFEFVPAAAWLLWHSPPPSLSAEAWHCARLAAVREGSPFRSWPRRLQLWQRGVGETLVGPAALLFVLSFQESELAALMQVGGWPERLFTDHTKGLPAAATLRLVFWPVVIQLPFVIPLVSRLGAAVSGSALSVLAEKGGVQAGGGVPPASRGLCRALAWVWVVAGLMLVVGQPVRHVVDGVLRAGRTVALQPRWGRELWDAVLLAGTCAAVTWGMAWLVAACKKPGFSLGSRTAVRSSTGDLSSEAGLLGRARFALGGSQANRLNGAVWIMLVPGLMGALALGLLTAGFFQRFLPGWAYTPVPLILAECLWLWPRVVLVRESIAARTRVTRHQVEMLAGSPDARQRSRGSTLWWRVAGTPMAGGVGLIAWWSYLEVMLPTILSMPGFEPAPKVMYNHLHYGQLEALGVKLALILSIPVLMAVCLTAVLLFLRGRRLT
jgi:hypothetical protein